jgi:hypothetical protein
MCFRNRSLRYRCDKRSLVGSSETFGKISELVCKRAWNQNTSPLTSCLRREKSPHDRFSANRKIIALPPGGRRRVHHWPSPAQTTYVHARSAAGGAEVMRRRRVCCLRNVKEIFMRITLDQESAGYPAGQIRQLMRETVGRSTPYGNGHTRTESLRAGEWRLRG